MLRAGAATSFSKASGKGGPRHGGGSQSFGDGIPEEVHALALVRLKRHHRDAEVSGQPVDIDPDPLAPGHVHHVESDDHRDAQFQDLRHQIEIAFQIGGIDNRDDDIGPRFARLLAENDVDGEHFVGAARRQAVGAGQIDESRRSYRRAEAFPFWSRR